MKKLVLLVLFSLFAFASESRAQQYISPFLLLGMTQYQETPTTTSYSPFFTLGADIDVLGSRYVVPRLEILGHSATGTFTVPEFKFGVKAGYPFTYIKPYGLFLFNYPLSGDSKTLSGVLGAGAETSYLGRWAFMLELQYDIRESAFSDGMILQGGVKYTF